MVGGKAIMALAFKIHGYEEVVESAAIVPLTNALSSILPRA